MTSSRTKSARGTLGIVLFLLGVIVGVAWSDLNDQAPEPDFEVVRLS